MVAETIATEGNSFGVITRIARQLGIGSESLRIWVRQAEIDSDSPAGTTSVERERIAELENHELRRANEILKSASIFFAGNSTPDRSDERLHRHASRSVRGRADLPHARPRPLDLLRR